MLAAFAIAESHAMAFALMKSFGYHVWGQGVDASTDVGLRRIVEAAGMQWTSVQQALSDPNVEQKWRKITSENVEALESYGYWGVPCVRYAPEHCVLWGQDKFYALEVCLKHATGAALLPWEREVWNEIQAHAKL